MDISEQWRMLDSSKQRWIKIVGGILLIILVLSLIPGRDKREAPDTVSDVQVDILGDDQGAGDLSQLAAEIRVMKAEREQTNRTLQQLQRRQQGLQNALSAATNIADNPEQLGALVDEMNRLKEDLQEMQEKGYQAGSNGGTQPPVQLVLGNEGAATETGVQQTAGQPRITSPFSDATNEDAGLLAKYDPLSNVKGAITDGATDKSRANQGFGFMKDSNFERPAPQIVIDEPEPTRQQAVRSAGSRPGQTSRDRRGELIDVETTPEIYIPSGSLFQGVLLNGMDAPTSSGSAREPYPATIRLTSLAMLPNRFTTNVRECFVLAAGFGRLDSERVHLRTEMLSCVLQDGGVIDVPIEGYITGEDGKVGLRGVVVERTGQLLMRAALAGLGSGFSEALQPRQIQSVRTGGQAGGVEFDAPDTSEVLEIGAYAGAAGAMEKLSDYYLERADQIFPIIEIDAMRTVTVHLSAGVNLKTLDGSRYGTMAASGSE